VTSRSKSKKGYFSRHAKSTAALVSLVIHAVLIVVALSFVAVTVIQKEEQVFEAKPIKRPKMAMKKLQVPVNIKKKKMQMPKLRKRIMVQPKLNQSMPDIRIPEISGIKGGLGSAGRTGLVGAGGLGFSMPEIELFGIRSKGEKLFFVLDSSPNMMVDGIGGIPAFRIIKSELLRILDGLDPTVLFNVAVFDKGQTFTLFPRMVPANGSNVGKIKGWLDPLNAVSRGMGDKDYGAGTLGPGGTLLNNPLQADPLKSSPGHWMRPTLLAMKQQADSVFVLTCQWGSMAYVLKDGSSKWSESKWTHWRERVAQAQEKLNEENKKRRARGQPPRVVGEGERVLVRAYFPDEPMPPDHTWYDYSSRELVEALGNMRDLHAPQQRATSSGLSRKKRTKQPVPLNVIHFVEKDSGTDGPRFKSLVGLADGEYRQIKGLAAIRSHLSGTGD